MKILRLAFPLLLVSVLFLSSCDKDCSAPALSENIIGSWTLSGSNVEFQADGTLIDPEDAVYGLEVNGKAYDQKSYVVTGNTLEVTIMPSDASDSSSIELDVTGNECDKITINFLGFNVDMNRN